MKKTTKLSNEEESQCIECCDGNWIAQKDKSGLFIYKATDKLFKTGTKILTKKLHDLPRYKIVNQIEDSFKKEVNSYLNNQTLSIVKLMKQLIK